MNSRLVKICGLRDPDNIREVLKLKPDWIGLIFYPGSPRYLSDPESLRFLNDLTKRPFVAGVFVDATLQEIQKVTEVLKLDAIQLHGSETPEFCKSIRDEGYLIIKAFGMHPDFEFSTTSPFEGLADYFLFDTKSRLSGGSGEQFRWDILNKYQGNTPWILSGGLSPDTLIFPNHRMMAGADLNSRFEKSPGIKDISLLQKFITHFRNE